MAAAGRQVGVAGRSLRLTNPDKVLFAASGTTKAELVDYYRQVAPVLLPLLRGRPVTRKRWPEGVSAGGTDHQGPVFFTKHVDSGTPDWVPRVRVEHSDRPLDYPLAEEVATLVWFAQLAAIELHVPQWRFDADGRPGHPDRLVLDLDPGPGVGLAECATVARSARDLLAELGLDCVPVTSGSKGIHLYAGLDGARSSEEVNAWARDLAAVLQRIHPDLVVSTMRRSERTGRVLVDWSQNNGAKTTITPYSVRGRERPWVAAPRSWEELDADDLTQLDTAEVLARLARGIEPMGVEPAGVDLAAVEQEEVEPGGLGSSRAPRSSSADHVLAGSVSEPLSPMLATPATRGRGWSGGWEFELKWDGVRAVAHVDPAGVRLRSRRGLTMVETYPELVRALAVLQPRRVVLDAEVVAPEPDGRPSFARLQQRINLTRAADVARAAAQVGVQLVCFDLLALDGADLTGRPYQERRHALSTLLEQTPGLDARVQAPPSLGTDVEPALEVSRAMGMEGLVAKRLGSRYHPGVRSEHWLKLKDARHQEVVVVGWRPGRGNREGGLGSLLVAVPGPDGLHYAGRVGSGFSARGADEALTLLDPLARPDPPLTGVPAVDARDARWLQPELVAEVGYGEWTPTGRLRHPVWRGWRPDRSPGDVEVAEGPLAGG